MNPEPYEEKRPPEPGRPLRAFSSTGIIRIRFYGRTRDNMPESLSARSIQAPDSRKFLNLLPLNIDHTVNCQAISLPRVCFQGDV